MRDRIAAVEEDELAGGLADLLDDERYGAGVAIPITQCERHAFRPLIDHQDHELSGACFLGDGRRVNHGLVDVRSDFALVEDFEHASPSNRRRGAAAAATGAARRAEVGRARAASMACRRSRRPRTFSSRQWPRKCVRRRLGSLAAGGAPLRPVPNAAPLAPISAAIAAGEAYSNPVAPIARASSQMICQSGLASPGPLQAMCSGRGCCWPSTHVPATSASTVTGSEMAPRCAGGGGVAVLDDEEIERLQPFRIYEVPREQRGTHALGQAGT